MSCLHGREMGRFGITHLRPGGGFSDLISFVTQGIKKEAVLPEPVWAHAIRSRPLTEMGTVYFWMGVGLL